MFYDCVDQKYDMFYQSYDFIKKYARKTIYFQNLKKALAAALADREAQR